MYINIEGMTEYNLLKFAKRGVEAKIEMECNCGAGSSRISALRELIQQLDIIDAALDELRHREEAT